MCAMPPVQGDYGVVERREYVNGGEQNPFMEQVSIGEPQQSLVQKEGEWDDSQLIPDRPLQW